MLSGIIRGATSYLEGFRFLLKHRLLRYFIFPGLLGGIALIGLLSLFVMLLKVPLSGLLHRLTDKIPIEGVAEFLSNQMDWVSLVLLGGIGFIFFKNLLIAVMSPFMSPLSERIEQIVEGDRAVKVPFSFPRIINEIFRGLRISFRNIFKEILLTLILLLLGLIPIFTPFSIALIFLVQAYYAGFGNLDYTLERKYSVHHAILFIRDHRGLAIGNGIVFLLLLFIPVAGILIAPPLATAAGTLEVLKRLPVDDEFPVADY